MKFPSIIRLPKHRTFDFPPRYFDPVKDELDERTERIKRELALEKKSGTDGEAIRGTIKFERSERGSKASASLLQLIIAAFLAIFCFTWLFYGNVVFYSLIAIIPVYFYFRLKSKIR